MDNLASHKGAAVRRAIRAAGALLIFLPPYSPDLNPIEQAFSKLKTLLRKENARTREQIETCIRDLLAKITTKECANYFTDAGYST
jgi:transposase